MHFKLGLYEHQSAGAIEGLVQLLTQHPGLLESPQDLTRIAIRIYEPAYSIICDPAKRDPHTRQSADHSLIYIVATVLRKAFESHTADWQSLMLLPADYNEKAIHHPETRRLMQLIDVAPGGAKYDADYPDGIPTSVELTHQSLGNLSSGRILYPTGHARDTSGQLERLLDHKFEQLAGLAVDDPAELRERLTHLGNKTRRQIVELYDWPIRGLTDATD
jgi:2-methylcitrate dehydratase